MNNANLSLYELLSDPVIKQLVPPPKTRKCLYCGTWLAPDYPKTKRRLYCSPACRQAYY